MTLQRPKWIPVVLAMLCVAVSTLAQPAAGEGGPPAGGPQPVPRDPLMQGVMRTLGERFTPELRSRLDVVVAQCGSEMERCQSVYVQELAATVGLPVEKALELFPGPESKAPQGPPGPLPKRLAKLVGKRLDEGTRKRLKEADERQLACVRPWQERIVERVAAITGLSLEEVAALAPWSRTQGKLGGSAGPGEFDTDGPGAFCSDFLTGPLLVCKGTVRPQGTERVLMPFIAANRERFEGKRVLDIGTGSGILALYAAQLQAAKVVATDIEPAAIDCTRENARALGVGRVVETRLVSAQDPSAYSVIHPGELFDIILGAPPAEVNRTPVVTSGGLDEGVTSNDNLRLGLSIVDGLREHLSPDGAALLFYPSDLMLPILVSYARHQGYLVEYHPALQLQPADWYALYNTFAVQVARTERVPPGALLLPPVDIALGSLAFGQYRTLDWTHDGRAYSRLWGKDVERLYLGMIVIRKGTGQSGRPPG